MLWTLIQRAKASRKGEGKEKTKAEAEKERELETHLLVMETPRNLCAMLSLRANIAIGEMNANKSMSLRRS